MKRIISQTNNTITVNELTGKELVAYKSKDGKKFGYLSRLNSNGQPDSFGFISLYDTGRPPSFISNSALKSIQIAIDAQRDVRMFATTEEMLDAIRNQTF